MRSPQWQGGEEGGQASGGGVNISAVKGVKYVCEGRSGRVKHLVWGKSRAVRVRI